MNSNKKREFIRHFADVPFAKLHGQGEIVDDCIIHKFSECNNIREHKEIGRVSFPFLHRLGDEFVTIKVGRGAWIKVPTANKCEICFGTPVKYIDILTYHTVLWNFPNTKLIANTGIKDRCMAWTDNHETATMHVNSEIHPKASVVWFQLWNIDLHFIEKYELRNSNWFLIETSTGLFKLRNNNPFNNIPSEFNQNKRGK